MENRNLNIESIVPVIKKATPWVIIWSVVTFICGILAIVLPLTVSFGIALIIGCLVLVAGIANLVFAFQTHNKNRHEHEIFMRHKA
jgi:uncharacterized membrane protein HdeD (DUF308 family)